MNTVIFFICFGWVFQLTIYKDLEIFGQFATKKTSKSKCIAWREWGKLKIINAMKCDLVFWPANLNFNLKNMLDDGVRFINLSQTVTLSYSKICFLLTSTFLFTISCTGDFSPIAHNQMCLYSSNPVSGRTQCGQMHNIGLRLVRIYHFATLDKALIHLLW